MEGFVWKGDTIQLMLAMVARVQVDISLEVNVVTQVSLERGFEKMEKGVRSWLGCEYNWKAGLTDDVWTDGIYV